MGVVSVMTVLHIKEEHVAEFAKMSMASARKSVRTEEKCLALEISLDDKKPGRFLMYEVFIDAEAHAAHLKLPRTIKMIDVVERWSTRKPQGVGPIPRLVAPNK